MNQWSVDIVPRKAAETLDDLFYERARRSPTQIAYRHHERHDGWIDLTWEEMARWVARWRSALAAEGLGAGERIAILQRNSPQWVMIDQAALSLGLVTVPLYTDDRAENAAFILANAGARVLFIQDAGRWERLAEVLGEHTLLQRIVIIESSAAAQQCAAKDARVVRAADWVPETGPALEPRRGDDSALATIVYTSGTTGHPKGVMLTHRNLLGNARAVLSIIDCYQQDVFLSFLPLSHTLERTGGYYLPMLAGATVTFARSVAQLAEDMQRIRPTVIIAVPRVFERVHRRILDQLGTRSPIVRWLFSLTVASGWRVFLRQQGRGTWHPLIWLWPFLQRRLANPVLEKLGGRLRIAVSGGAALPGPVAHTFIGLGLPLVQGYGLTETSPVISCNPLNRNIPESVGVALPGIELRIAENDELLVKGESIMQGYWDNPQASAAVLDTDGWLRTGDQARLDRGHLYIIGRIKDILVLSNGEKVPPGEIETAISADPLFEQTLLLGEGCSHLSAIVVLNQEHWPAFAAALELDPNAPESLRDQALHKALLKRIRLALKGFPGYAKIRRVTPTLEPWTIENGLLTPTMKVKRKDVTRRYQDDIEKMQQIDA